MLEWLIACLSLPDQLYLTTTMSNSPVLRKNSVLFGSLTDPRDKP